MMFPSSNASMRYSSGRFGRRAGAFQLFFILLFVFFIILAYALLRLGAPEKNITRSNVESDLNDQRAAAVLTGFLRTDDDGTMAEQIIRGTLEERDVRRVGSLYRFLLVIESDGKTMSYENMGDLIGTTTGGYYGSSNGVIAPESCGSAQQVVPNGATVLLVVCDSYGLTRDELANVKISVTDHVPSWGDAVI
jgi:hypothetical protein